jgi:hypothetical protein
VKELEQKIDSLERSLSWKLTASLRFADQVRHGERHTTHRLNE